MDPQLILNALQGSLNPDKDIRIEAEHALEQFSKHPNYAVALAKIVVSQNNNINVYIRQLAGVILRRYVKENWNNVSEEDKAILRENLPIGLTDPNTKFTTAVSMIMGEIAENDFPEKWPNLVTNLLHLFENSNPTAPTAGSSMKCLLVVSEHFNDAQVQFVFPNLVPYMMRTSIDERYSQSTRARALQVVNKLYKLLSMVSLEFEEGTQKLLKPVIDPTLKIVTTNITSSPSVQIRCESLKVIMTMVKNFGKEIKINLAAYVWESLKRSYQTYLDRVVEGVEEEEFDEEGDSINFSTLICQQLELLLTLLTSKIHRKYFKNIANLTDLIVGYMQLTTSDLDLFQDDPNQFISDEDNIGVRDSCQNILNNVINEFGKNGMMMVIKSVGLCLVESDARMKRNDKSWWKMREAAILGLGSLQEELLAKQVPFDSETLLKSLFALDLSSNNVFLQARAIHIISQLHEIVPNQLLSQFSQFLSAIIAPGTKAPVGLQLYACRAVGRLVEADSIEPNAIRPILAGVCTLSGETTDDTAHIVLEALAALINAKPECIEGAEQSVIQILVQLITKFSSDPMIPSDILNVIDKIAKSKSYEKLLQLLAPYLAQQLMHVQTEERLRVVQILIDVATSLIRFSKTDQHRVALLNTVFVPVATLILDNDDAELLQNGAECLRGFVYTCGNLLVSHKLPNNAVPVQLLLNVVGKLLQPDLPESASMQVGDLISLLFTKVGSVLDSNTIQGILVATVRKLSTATSLSLIQTLVFLYAKLFLTLFDQTLQFLISNQAETIVNNQPVKISALELVLIKWCDCQPSFFGKYKLKVTALGLIKLLQSSHKSLDSVKVIVDVPSRHEGMRTRSKGPPPQQAIPFILQAFILIVDSYARVIESNVTNQKDLHALMYGYHGSDTDEDYDDTDEDEEYDGDMDELANLVSNNQEDDEEEDDIEDPFSQDDSLNQVDLLQLVPNVVREACNKYGQQLINGCTPFMTASQQKTLEGILNPK